LDPAGSHGARRDAPHDGWTAGTDDQEARPDCSVGRLSPGWRACRRQKGVEDQFVTTDLNTLLTALYVKIDDWLGAHTRPGRPPKLSDAELLTLAVAQELLGVRSEARWLRFVPRHLARRVPLPARTIRLQQAPARRVAADQAPDPSPGHRHRVGAENAVTGCDLHILMYGEFDDDPEASKMTPSNPIGASSPCGSGVGYRGVGSGGCGSANTQRAPAPSSRRSQGVATDSPSGQRADRAGWSHDMLTVAHPHAQPYAAARAHPSPPCIGCLRPAPRRTAS
jgi:hypothetical protein